MNKQFRFPSLFSFFFLVVQMMIYRTAYYIFQILCILFNFFVLLFFCILLYLIADDSIIIFFCFGLVSFLLHRRWYLFIVASCNRLKRRTVSESICLISTKNQGGAMMLCCRRKCRLKKIVDIAQCQIVLLAESGSGCL